MPLLTPSEKSALEMMLRNKLGSGVGTSALLKVLDHVESFTHAVATPVPIELQNIFKESASEVEPTTPVVTGEVAVEVTESSP